MTMVITTDKDEQVHFHGYDIHFDCKANTPLSKTFTLDKSGSFEMELEATSTHLTNFAVHRVPLIGPLSCGPVPRLVGGTIGVLVLLAIIVSGLLGAPDATGNPAAQLTWV